MLPVDKSEFWKERIYDAIIKNSSIHYAVYVTDADNWQRIQNETSGILQRYIYPHIKLLDVGCGYGALYGCLPSWHQVKYTGIDVSEEFIDIARKSYPEVRFIMGDVRKTEFHDKEFDLVVARSIKNMVCENLGIKYWQEMETEIKRISKTLLLIEYDDPLTIEHIAYK